MFLFSHFLLFKYFLFQEQRPVVTPWFLDLMGTMTVNSKIPTWKTGNS